MTTPQLPVFAPVFRQTPAEYRQVEERLTSMPDCEVLQDPISDLLASISHSIELSLLEAPVGISRHLQVTFLPAVPRMSIISWEGSSQAFWHRLQFLCTGSHRHLLQQGHELIQQAMTHWHGDEPSLQDFLNLARPHLQFRHHPATGGPSGHPGADCCGIPNPSFQVPKNLSSLAAGSSRKRHGPSL